MSNPFDDLIYEITGIRPELTVEEPRPAPIEVHGIIIGATYGSSKSGGEATATVLGVYEAYPYGREKEIRVEYTYRHGSSKNSKRGEVVFDSSSTLARFKDTYPTLSTSPYTVSEGNNPTI